VHGRQLRRRRCNCNRDLVLSFASGGLESFRTCGSGFCGAPKMEKARSLRAFCDVGWCCGSSLGRRGERLDVPELS